MVSRLWRSIRPPKNEGLATPLSLPYNTVILIILHDSSCMFVSRHQALTAESYDSHAEVYSRDKVEFTTVTSICQNWKTNCNTQGDLLLILYHFNSKNHKFTKILCSTFRLYFYNNKELRINIKEFKRLTLKTVIKLTN
jgi:hypothetical protein